MFYALWSIREVWGSQYLDVMDSVPSALLSACIKIAIWILPVILLVQWLEQKNPYTYLGLRHHVKTGFKWAAWGSFILLSYFVVLHLIVLNNTIHFQIGFNEWLNTILLVGIIEEIVFRGFLLQKLLASFRFWTANIVTSLLFVSIHFPIWYEKGIFEFPTILSSIVTAFILSIIFGLLYKKSGSLWSAIILHSLYNLLVSVFYS